MAALLSVHFDSDDDDDDVEAGVVVGVAVVAVSKPPLSTGLRFV